MNVLTKQNSLFTVCFSVQSNFSVLRQHDKNASQTIFNQRQTTQGMTKVNILNWLSVQYI